MGETANVAEVSAKISKDIFRPLGWHMHPKWDDNFDCLNEDHKTSGGEPKKSHPTDVVFSYDDPYLAKRVYLLTDLKSYAKGTITHTKLRTALKSLAVTVDCASRSDQWRQKFGVDLDEPHEIRGLLFVHNHDHEYAKCFYEELAKVNTKTLPIARGNIIHFLGPRDIQRLFTITNDILRLKGSGELPTDYTFFYPDLVMRRRHGDIWEQAATFEALAGPFLTIKYKAATDQPPGYLIYYNRSGGTTEEFEYLLDCCSRFQMLDSDESVRIRVCHPEADGEMNSRFELATRKYAKAWRLDPARIAVLKKIKIERVTAMTDSYHPGDMGWRA